jgi:hypothetical protein
VKPDLEELTPRIVPSASGGESQPAALPTVAGMEQQEIQLTEAVQNEIIGIVKMVAEEIAQDEASLQQQWNNLFSDFFSPHNPSPTYSTPSAGSGSGNVAATTPHENAPTEGTIKPMAGGGGGGTTGSTATVSGQVWLDNNADGDEDDGESGYSGVTVELETSAGGVVATTTTNASGNYSFTVSGQSSTPQYYQIQVIFPQLFFATTEDSESEINSGGYSAVFALTAGATQAIPARIDSMKVTTNQDDANGAIAKQITLRDAMNAGNKGDGPQVTFASDVTGTISLQAALPAIGKSYNIVGTGGTTNITVQGNGNAASPYRIFTINAGVTSAISGLTIQGGYDTTGTGGGILNNGTLTLESDNINYNQTSGSGGGVYNASGAQLDLKTDVFYENTARSWGGGLANYGKVTIWYDTVFQYNQTSQLGGGGIYNNGGTITIYNNTNEIIDNTSGASGGGVQNANDGKFIMNGGSISNNKAKSNGGGVSNGGATMTLSGVGAQGNQAKKGGGIYVASGKLTLKQATIGGENSDPNKAANGGGMYVYGGKVNVSRGAISNNTATTTNGIGGGGTGGGGGLLVTGGILTLWDVFISGNTSKSAGGGIAMVAGGGVKTVTVTGGTIGFNTAAGTSGGGIYASAGSLTINSVTIKGTLYPANVDDNTAKNQGGGLYLGKNSTTAFNGVTVESNKANGKLPNGAGVYEQQGSTVNIFSLTDKDDPNGKPVPGP